MDDFFFPDSVQSEWDAAWDELRQMTRPTKAITREAVTHEHGTVQPPPTTDTFEFEPPATG